LQGGYATYKCSLCGDTYEKYESALGHTTSEGTCSRCGESFGSWEITFYVDEFNNPTNQAYIRTSDVLYGTFSNSATTDSTLYARILIDTEDIAIKLWEYGRNEVNAYTSTDYKITILDDSGTKHYTTGTMYKNGDRIYLADWTLVNLLQDNAQLKIYIQENSKYGVNSTYLFSVKNGNFNSIYYDFYYDYMD
jgi:DNA-directed RNA polymerase subunit RPC12/RpoP